MTRALLILITLCGGLLARGATKYCSPAGGGTGADFNNLATLPDDTGFTRGDTYVLVDGDYGNVTLGTALSGTTTITFRKASTADSGVAGYSTTLHDGEADLNYFVIHTGYWTISGSTRNESDWTAGYGFRASTVNANSFSGDDPSHSTISYVDAGGPYSNSTYYADMGYAMNLTYNFSNIVVSRCFIHNGLPALVQGNSLSHSTWEYNQFGPGWGKTAIRFGNGGRSVTNILRYNVFKDSTQSAPDAASIGLTGEIAIWHNATNDMADLDGNEIYGNVFYSTVAPGGFRNTCIIVGGDTNGNWLGRGAWGTKVYNNTLVGFTESASMSLILLNGGGTVAYNNIGHDLANGAITVQAVTTANNTYFASSPFVNYAGGNYQLSSAQAGTSLGTPYNTDLLGVTRGADDVFDIGAYEYVSGGGGGAQTQPILNVGTFYKR